MDRRRIGALGEGDPYPDIILVSFDTRTRVSWKHYRRHLSGLEFLDVSGCEWIAKDEFRHVCPGLVDAVVERLEFHGISGTLLQEEWKAIQIAKGDERQFCRIAAAIGWDPY